MGDDTITSDVLCTRCGYNLRHQSRRGRCPECGRSVAHAMLDRPGWVGDLGWQRRVAGGLKFVTIGLAWSAAMFLSLPVMGGARANLPNAAAWWLGLLGVWLAGPAVTLGVGMWRVGTLEPGGVWDDRSRVIALMLRGLALLRAAAWVVLAVVVVCLEVDTPPAWLADLVDRLPDGGVWVGVLVFIELETWLIYIVRVLRLHGAAGGRGVAIGWLGTGVVSVLIVIALIGTLLGNETLIELSMVGIVLAALTIVTVSTAMLWHALGRMAGEAS